MSRKRKTPQLSEREKLIRDSNPAIRNRILCSIQARFEHGGNPLAVWDAYLLARRMGEPIPEWILARFEKTAEKLCKIPRGNPPAHVMTALGIHTQGKGSSFTRYMEEIKRWKVVRRCNQLHEEDPGRDYEQIYRVVVEEFSEKGIELQIGTVEKWFRSLQEPVRRT